MGPMNPMAGPGGMMGVDAEKFSEKLVQLKIGSTTKQQAIEALGKPVMESEDALIYRLVNTGSAEGARAHLLFRNGILTHKGVGRSKFENGVIKTEEVYKKGGGF